MVSPELEARATELLPEAKNFVLQEARRGWISIAYDIRCHLNGGKWQGRCGQEEAEAVKELVFSDPEVVNELVALRERIARDGYKIREALGVEHDICCPRSNIRALMEDDDDHQSEKEVSTDKKIEKSKAKKATSNPIDEFYRALMLLGIAKYDVKRFLEKKGLDLSLLNVERLRELYLEVIAANKRGELG